MQAQTGGSIDDEQRIVTARFEQAASHWTALYEGHGVYEEIFQERLRTALDIVRRLGLPFDTRALVVGCGGGFGAAALAEMGFSVDAIDPVQAMIDATRDRARQVGQEQRVQASVGDVRALSFPDETFGLVEALGVLPWVSPIQRPLQEMRRVLKAGGYAILTVNNRWSIRAFLDPMMNPLLEPAKEMAKRALRRPPKARLHLISLRQCNALLTASGFETVERLSFGFAPFTVFGSHLLPSSLALRLHSRLQAAARRGFPVLRSGGTWWLICARRK